jgi:hypothetical protein
MPRTQNIENNPMQSRDGGVKHSRPLWARRPPLTALHDVRYGLQADLPAAARNSYAPMLDVTLNPLSEYSLKYLSAVRTSSIRLRLPSFAITLAR